MEAVTAHTELLRRLYPRVLAKTLGLTRSLPDAEDAVQDACERALRAWSGTGTPDSPEAWLVTVAANAWREGGNADGAPPERSGERIGAVLRTIHLLFNEGYWSSHDEAPIRAELCRLAIGLARSLVEAFPAVTEAAGLLALLFLHDARRGAQLSPDGAPIPLPEQDRQRWDREGIAAATDLLDRALEVGEPGPFQIEAAISAVHCRAASAEQTDWREIAALYGLLEVLRPTPAVRVNRSFAVARAEGPAAGLALLEGEVAQHPSVHLVRGTLLAEVDQLAEARAALQRAIEHARNAHERGQIHARLRKLDEVKDHDH